MPQTCGNIEPPSRRNRALLLRRVEEEPLKKTKGKVNVRNGKKLARPAGLEPAAYGLGNHRSIQLSYGRTRTYENGLHGLGLPFR